MLAGAGSMGLESAWEPIMGRGWGSLPSRLKPLEGRESFPGWGLAAFLCAVSLFGL